MSSDTVIADVETALRQVLDPSTSAADKQQLEHKLSSFKDTPAVCLPVLYTLLRTSQNEYALWFAATTLEEYVAKKWVHFSLSDQTKIRHFVWEFLLSTSSIPFVRRKLQKVVADIARIQWRDATKDWPDFLSQLEALIEDEHTRIKGLELLAVVVDEFSRDDVIVFASVKREAQCTLVSHVARLLALLANVLTKCSHVLQTGELQDVTAQDQVANLALTTLNTLITTTPVAELLTEAWMTLLFQLATCWDPILRRGLRLPDQMASVTAVQCLTEVLAKRSQVDKIMAQAMHHVCSLLQTTVDAMEQVADLFVDKVCDFVHVIITHHFHRLEEHETLLQAVYTLTRKQTQGHGLMTCFSIWHVFVSSIEERQESGRPVLGMYENGLIAVMQHLIERVLYKSNASQLETLDDVDDDDVGTQRAGNDTDMDVVGTGGYAAHSYHDLAQLRTDAMNGTVDGTIATKVQLSERKEFVVDCLALFRRMAALPSCGRTLFEQMFPQVQNDVSTVFFHLHEMHMSTNMSEQEKPHDQVLHDLTLECAILSSVCTTIFTEDKNDPMTGWQLLQLFLKMAQYLVHHRLTLRGKAWCELHCEILTSIRCSLGCLALVQERGACVQITDSIVQMVLETMDTSRAAYPLTVLHSCMHLLGTLGLVLSYDELREIPSMMQLETHVQQLCTQLPRPIQVELYTALSTLYVQAITPVRTEQWAHSYRAFLTPLRTSIEASARSVHPTDHRVVEPTVVEQLQRDCDLVRCLARSIETKPTVVKAAFVAVYNPALPSIQTILKTYMAVIRQKTGESARESKHAIKNALAVVNDTIRLYAQLLQSIRKEMQKDTVADLMRTFVDMFHDAHVSQVLYAEGAAGLTVLCGFLELLTIVMAEPTPVFTSFVPTVVDLCFGVLHEPIFAHPDSPALSLGYFVALMEQVLATHFRSFVAYTGQFTSAGGRERQFASDRARTSFVSIFHALASVLTRDQAPLAPRVCTQVLRLLDRVDRAHSLFAFAGFQTELRMGFLATLLTLLTRGDLTLLQDDAIALLHRVAAVDFASFYQHFVPRYVDELLTPAQRDAAVARASDCLQWSGQVDLPTFARDVGAFLNDVKVLQAQY
ncbi:hypothetical protein PsorP6_015045 [Peronosclerospora sorghi]|uniref:Uncharacterized protein n=1 Tax=Peronosclerospora sorghi TaxID=230839 RepID=A0ACC0VSI0_9STRA|nr:hypothetical protein PsorP6_015045 [Peronosclerospora sorghi]